MASDERIRDQIATVKIALAQARSEIRNEPDDQRENPIWDGINELRGVISALLVTVQGLVEAFELVSEPETMSAPNLDDLAKLALLRDSGALSDEEFTTQKARILN